MQRERVTGKVISKKASEFRQGVFYVTAEVAGWGQVKFVTTKKTMKEGDLVLLQTQKNRNMTDIIRWEEVR